MGRKVDGFVGRLLLMVGLYLYFRGAFASRPLCILLAAGASFFLFRLFRLLFGRISGLKCFKMRAFRKKAGGVLMHLACMDSTQAQEKTERLLRQHFQEEFTFYLVQDHPSLSLSRMQIFSIWRENAGAENLLICTTGRADNETKLFAQSLRSPRLAIIDGEMLARLIAENPQGFEAPGRPEKQRRVRSAMLKLSGPRNTLRCVMLALSMLVMYLFSANVSYLAAALLLVFLLLCGLPRRKMPTKLF